MDQLMQQRHKMGFKLFGNLDQNQTYEIYFSPGEAPSGSINHLLKQDEKKVAVELPQEVLQGSFETICTYFLERDAHLVVKVHGHEKLGNRKLILESSYDSNDTVNLRISIQGKWQSMSYNIELNPFDISSSTGEIQKKNAKGFSQVPISLDELIHIKKSEALKVFPKLKPNNFYVSMDQDQIIVHLGLPLRQFIDSLGKPSKYQKAKVEKIPAPVVANEMTLSSDEEMNTLIKEMSSSITDPVIEEAKPSKESRWPIFRKMFGKG